MVVQIGKMVYTRYRLYELYEICPELQDLVRRRWLRRVFEEVCKGAAADVFTQYITGITLYPRTMEASHVLHRMLATRVT
jgi:hypothetical protein